MALLLAPAARRAQAVPGAAHFQHALTATPSADRGASARAHVTSRAASPAAGTAPTERWSVQLDGYAYGAAAVAGNTLYVGTAGGSVYALNTQDGTTVWQVSVGSGVYATPAIVDGALYVGSEDGQLHALDLADGSTRWTYAAGEALLSTPQVVDGVVYIGSDDGAVHAVDAVTGTRRWRTPLLGGSEIVVADGIVYATSWTVTTSATGKGVVAALDADRGTKRWSIPVSDFLTRPVLVGDTVITATSGGDLSGQPIRVLAFSTTNGKPRWSLKLDDCCADSVGISAADGTVYVAGRLLSAVDAASGKLRWQFAPPPLAVQGSENADPGDLSTTPVLVNGVLYVEGRYGLYAVDPADGTMRWRLMGGPQWIADATIAGQLFIVSGYDKTLRAYGAV